MFSCSLCIDFAPPKPSCAYSSPISFVCWLSSSSAIGITWHEVSGGPSITCRTPTTGTCKCCSASWNLRFLIRKTGECYTYVFSPITKRLNEEAIAKMFASNMFFKYLCNLGPHSRNTSITIPWTLLGHRLCSPSADGQEGRGHWEQRWFLSREAHLLFLCDQNCHQFSVNIGDVVGLTNALLLKWIFLRIMEICLFFYKFWKLFIKT